MAAGRFDAAKWEPFHVKLTLKYGFWLKFESLNGGHSHADGGTWGDVVRRIESSNRLYIPTHQSIGKRDAIGWRLTQLRSLELNNWEVRGTNLVALRTKRFQFARIVVLANEASENLNS